MERAGDVATTGGAKGVRAAAIGPCAAIPVEHMAFIREVLDRIGDKCSLLLIAVLERARCATPTCSAKSLRSPSACSLTLRQLQQDGLSARTAYAEVSPRIEYALTPLGCGLHEIATSLVGWAAAHHDEIRENRARTTSAQSSTGACA